MNITHLHMPVTHHCLNILEFISSISLPNTPKYKRILNIYQKHQVCHVYTRVSNATCALGAADWETAQIKNITQTLMFKRHY